MSTILDALRKAEQERDLGKVPDLRSFHAVPASAPRRGWPGVVLGVVLINAVVLAWLLGRGSLFAGPVAPPAASAMGDSPAVTAPAATPPAPAPVVATAHSPAMAEVAPRPITAPASATATPTLPAPEPVATAPARSTDPDLLSLPPETVLALRDTPAPQPLAAMPESFQRALPTLNLDVHVYSDEAARRFVLINGRRYREGDWIQEGPLLETIAADGVIMNHQQARFLIPVER